jgi:polysaccharide biosynthesis transport protein
MTDEELQEKPELIEWSEVKEIVRRQRWYFLLPFFAGWLVIWSVSWVLPSTYRSGTLILVEQPAVPEKYVVSNIDIDIQQQMDSISQQILSRTRLLRIIDKLNLYANNRKHKSPDETVEEMRKDIGIDLVRSDDGSKKLSAFNIYYSNRDPRMAQAGANELANLFITENLEQRQQRSENTTEFLQEQLDQARQKLAEQEARVRQFKDQHLGELPTQMQTNLQILAGTQTELQAQEDALNRAKQQNTYLESLVSQYRAVEHGTKSGDASPSGLAAIDKELDALKAKLADLSSHYTDQYPDVRKTREQIAKTEKLRERTLAEMKNAPSVPADSTPDVLDPRNTPLLELQSQLKANRAEIANHTNEIRDLQAKVGMYQSRLNMAPVMEQQFADITRDYDQSKANYDSLLAKKNESEMSTDLEKSQQAEHFRMLDPPNLPLKPDKPKRLQLCALGVVLGLLLGGAVAGAREFLAGKLHSEREIKKLLPCSILAEIPALETAPEKESRMRSAWLAAGAAGAMAACILIGTAITYLRG